MSVNIHFNSAILAFHSTGPWLFYWYWWNSSPMQICVFAISETQKLLKWGMTLNIFQNNQMPCTETFYVWKPGLPGMCHFYNAILLLLFKVAQLLPNVCGWPKKIKSHFFTCHVGTWPWGRTSQSLYSLLGYGSQFSIGWISATYAMIFFNIVIFNVYTNNATPGSWSQIFKTIKPFVAEISHLESAWLTEQLD